MRHPFLAAAAALAALAAFSGCAKQSSSRPFADVDRNRYESTEAVVAGRQAGPAERVETDPTVPPTERALPATRPTVAELPSSTTRGVDPQGRPVAVSEALVPTTQHRVGVAPTVTGPLRPIGLQVTADGQLLRPWPESVSYRPSGDVLAGPTYWPTGDRAYRRDGLTNAYMEPLEFLWNGALMPFRAIQQHPQTPVIYSPINRVGGEP
jgi:hypothetical protein